MNDCHVTYSHVMSSACCHIPLRLSKLNVPCDAMRVGYLTVRDQSGDLR